MNIDFRKIAVFIDDRCRLFDLEAQRLCGGPLRAWGVQRENFEAFAWPSAIAAALWTGMPTLSLVQLTGIIVGVLTLSTLFFFNRKCKTAFQDLLVQVALLSALGILILIIGPDEAGTAIVYRHLLIPAVLIVGVSLLASSFVAAQLLRPLQQQSSYAEYLKRTEMFQSRGTRLPLAMSRLPRLLLALIGVLLQPLELLWPVAVAILAAPPAYVNLAALIAFAGMGVILLMAASDERLANSLALLMRRFFRNAALAVTLLTLALACARLFHNLYVTTVFDSASGIEILLYFFFAYSIAWWYDYWTERLIGEQLFVLIDTRARGRCSVPYAYAGCPFTSVPRDGRSIELHGLGRILAFRPNPANPRWPYFQAWSYRDFFTHLAATGAPGGKAVPLPQQVNQRLMFYLGSTALIASAMFVCGGLILHNIPKNYELSAATNHGSGLSLAQLLDPQTYNTAHPAIVVSASGGGTRAAVFAGAVLEGISEAQGQSVRVGSGVSGGSAALAYYAAKRPELSTGKLQPWDKYFDVLTMPFIQDVIERAQEWRMAQHGRLGVLLAESFERRWQLTSDRRAFGDLSDFGLICNSTLAGRFDRSFLPSAEIAGLTLAQADARYSDRTKSDVAGGRLIMTNLDLHHAFAGVQPPFVPGEHLPILVDDSRIRLERTAALSANFPPVFSNAAIDIDDQRRYWVTDGGAADNRGLEPLLFALRDAVHNGSARSAKLPAVLVVVIEASGIDETFEQNRGLGSALGAGAHFADQLDTELTDNLIATYRSANQENDLHFYYIPMPGILRTSGSFGTHWMLQGSIVVKNGSNKKTFKGSQVVRGLRAAYGCRAAENSAELVDWIRRGEEYKQWCELRNALQTGGAGASCGCTPLVAHPD